MSTQSNLNLNNTLQSFNTGVIGTFPELGTIRAVVFAPLGTVIPFSAQVSPAAFATHVNARLISDTRATQWFALTQLDKFEPQTKAANVEDTGRLQLTTYTFPDKLQFRYMQGMGNYIELSRMTNLQGYGVFFIDDFGNWHGTEDTVGGTNGLAMYTLAQMFVPNRGYKTTSTGNQYMFQISLADPMENNSGFKLVQANTRPDALVMLQNAFLLDVSDIVPPAVTTTSVTLTLKAGQGSWDVLGAYGSTITAACFVASDLTAGTTLTISSRTTGTTVVSGETYNWVKLVLSAAPTAGNVVRFALAAPSVVNAIIPNFNMVTLPLNNTNGANCAVHTF